MTMHLSTLGALVTLVMAAASPVVAEQSPCPPAGVTQPVDVIEFIGADYSDFGFPERPTTSNISVGRFVNQHVMSEAFVAGSASGADQIVATSQWLAPVSQNGAIVETVVYVAEGPNCGLVQIGDGAEVGTAISRLGSGDILFGEWPRGAWFKLNGTTVAGLNDSALRLHPDPLSLADYQAAVVARYDGESFDPNPSGSRPARDDRRQAERSETRRPLVLATLMGALAVLAVWAVRRFR